MTKKRLNEIPELRIGDFYAGITVSGERVQFGEKGRADLVFAEYDELVALQDWLNRALPAHEPTSPTHPDTARLDWLIRDYRGVDLYNALDGKIGVCEQDLGKVRAAIDEKIASELNRGEPISSTAKE